MNYSDNIIPGSPVKNLSVTRKAIGTLMNTPREWSGRTRFTDKDAYHAFLNKAYAIDSMTIWYSCRDLAAVIGVSEKTAARAIRRLCGMGYLFPKGTAGRGQAKSYDILTDVSPRWDDTVVTYDPQGVCQVALSDTLDKRKIKRKTSSSSLRYTECVSKSHPLAVAGSEGAAWLGKHGARVILALTDEPKSARQLARDAGVSRTTVSRVLSGGKNAGTETAETAGLAMRKDTGWIAGPVPLESYLPEPSIRDGKRTVERRLERWARERAQYHREARIVDTGTGEVMKTDDLLSMPPEVSARLLFEKYGAPGLEALFVRRVTG